MNNASKEPRMIYIGAAQKKIVDKIDKNKFLDLNDVSMSRMDLFIFAMALGIESNIESNVKSKESFVRSEYVKIKHDALLYSIYIYQLQDKEQLDSIINRDKIFELAQNYANTGFDLIDDMMKNKAESIIELELIKELDEDYEKYFG